ncbi:MAG: hypothetical protein FJY97_00980 [candidate division Zixibacteria bacterium]|nr:hypothetical protein [candidate division Zixibacteria bacterium]
MSAWREEWLVGSRGVYHGRIGGVWDCVGAQEDSVSDILRLPDRLVAAASGGSGLWEWRFETDGWVQLHDETLTEVLAIAAIEGDPGIVAGSPFGVAVAQRDQLGAVRWTHLSDKLHVAERFTNAILVDPGNPSCWLVGTETGVLVAHDAGTTWERTSLMDTPVRTLLHAHGLFWAGTDRKGVWCSQDGLRWDPAGHTIKHSPVYRLIPWEDRLIAATGDGVAVMDGQGGWPLTGPAMLCSGVAVDPWHPSCWVSGGAPGGLWYTEDAGIIWRQIPGFAFVWTVLPPERRRR